MTDAKRSALKSRSPLPTAAAGSRGGVTVRPGRQTRRPHARARAKGTAVMRLAGGSDPAGFHLKEHVKIALAAIGHEIIDVGPVTGGSVDYPQFAADAARLVPGGQARPRGVAWRAGGEADRGVLAGGSGVGVAIVANKVAGVRAVNAHDPSEAEMARRHNDANVVTLSGARLGPHQADVIVAAFLRTEFEGGRHARRVGQISALEERSKEPDTVLHS